VEPNLSQALHLLNGSTVDGKIDEGTVVQRMVRSGMKPAEIIENLYLRCFGRPPTAAESAKLEGFLAAAPSPEVVLSDLFWALLNSKEFAFNH
jgi:hypothetical protein